MRVLALEQLNRFPGFRAEPPVDAIGFRLHLDQQILVPLDARAARRADLHEAEALTIVRKLFEEAFDPQEALEDAFRVIHPVDAHAEKHAAAETKAEVGADRAG